MKNKFFTLTIVLVLLSFHSFSQSGRTSKMLPQSFLGLRLGMNQAEAMKTIIENPEGYRIDAINGSMRVTKDGGNVRFLAHSFDALVVLFSENDRITTLLFTEEGDMEKVVKSYISVKKYFSAYNLRCESADNEVSCSCMDKTGSFMLLSAQEKENTCLFLVNFTGFK